MEQPAPPGVASESPGCIKAEGTYPNQGIPSKINDSNKIIMDESIRNAGAMPQHLPRGGAMSEAHAGSLPPKVYGQQSPMHSNYPSSSARDTQITAPSRLFSGSLPSSEKDEYLLGLLSKGVKPPIIRHNSSSLPGSSSGFRVPDPVPHRAQQLRAAAPPHLPPRPHPGSSAPSVPQAPPAHDSAPVRPRHAHPRAPSQIPSSWSFADTQRGMGIEAAAALRSAVISHQVAFLDQLYDFHRALAVQKLLVRHCPEVKEVMSQAEAILKASSSREDPDHQASKRARKGDAGGEPSSESQEKLLHPDSQFAALPLSKDTATCDGSGGDDGDGSGGNGSGGGSTSPQPQIITAVPHGMVAMQPAPSGASQTPLGMFPWGGMQHAPMMMMHPHGHQWPGQQQGGGGPMQQQQQHYAAMAGAGPHNGGGMPGGAPPPMPPYGMMGGGDPLMWWYQDYYGRQAMAAQQAQQQQAPGGAQQMAAAAQQQQAGAGGPAGLNQVGPPSMQAPKWWQDPQQTFGPPADPEVIARAAAAIAAARRGDCAAAMEVESAPPSKGKVPSRSTATAVVAPASAGQATAAAGVAPPQTTAAAAAAPSAAGRSKSARLVAPPRRKHKRKPADPIAEASSGTSGQNHQLGPHAGLDDYAQDAEGGLHPAGADANVAKLLLSFSGQRAADR